MNDDDTLVTLEVTITRVIDQNGRMAVRIKTPAVYNFVELLGMIEAAKAYIYREIGCGA
jgi:hypothetical protein